MFDWIIKIFQKKNIVAPIKTDATSQHQYRPPRQPIYFLDVDAEGEFFARFVHVTSSVNADSISKNGLLPLTNVTERLICYLNKVFPNENAQVLLKEIIEAKPKSAINAGLVTQRLNEEKQQREVVALLPLGESNYLKSAADNATKDGGEVFKAARETVNVLHKKQIGPLYPDATSVVFIARHYLKRDKLSLMIGGCASEEYVLDLASGKESDFSGEWSLFQKSNPLHVTKPYPPEHLVRMSLDTYRTHIMKPISPAARKQAEVILTSHGSMVGESA
ncbi:PheA protein [Novimethylophilus kurashikiensis]|uniref:PheA protein n=1 Tax=Novimethylophilus kurashikiensis TaxID=1825523 RepID=A0A2R5F7P7_9PROT|nr:hypothetical protein [Novimethylophilus kurashikiensis]GBG14236.1 PheA protein [Novimethylophilus kurashikiensis]